MYIVLIVGSILISVVKTLKSDEKERTAKKNRPQPIAAETSDATPNPKNGKSKKRKTHPFFETKPDDEKEYFSYETMSDRDFAKEFEQTAEETAAVSTPQPSCHLNMDEESVFNGVVWSEILNRKY